MSLISLLTDFGLEDNFVGVMKGVILKINPSAQIIDINHNIKPQNIVEAAFLLKNSFKYFPQGTIHLVVVDPGVGSKRKKLLVKTKDYFFIGPDNGVLSLALKEDMPLEVIEITNEKYFLKPASDTFHGRDIFAPIAAYLSCVLDKAQDKLAEITLSKFGRPIRSFITLELPAVKISGATMIGEIIYIDHFGNLTSNIAKEAFENFVKNKKYKIYIKNRIIDRLLHSYAEGAPQRPLALIDSFNHLEISVNSASARGSLGVDKGAKVKIVKL